MKPEIFAVGYRRLDPSQPRSAPQWAIARTVFALAWRRRATKISLLFCLMVFGGAAMWLAGQLVVKRYAPELLGPGAEALELDRLVGQTRELLSFYLTAQFYMTAIAISVVAGGAIADDGSAGAFELYFARPLTRFQYATGKLLGAFLVPLCTLIVPVFILWLAAVGVADATLRAELWWMIGPVLLGALLASAVLAATIIGLSAIGKKGRTVSAIYVSALYVGSPIAETLAAEGLNWAGYLAPQRNLRVLVDSLLQVQQTSFGGELVRGADGTDLGVLGACVALFVFIAGGLTLLSLRLRRVSA